MPSGEAVMIRAPMQQDALNTSSAPSLPSCDARSGDWPGSGGRRGFVVGSIAVPSAFEQAPARLGSLGIVPNFVVGCSQLVRSGTGGRIMGCGMRTGTGRARSIAARSSAGGAALTAGESTASRRSRSWEANRSRTRFVNAGSAPYTRPMRHPIDPKVDCVFKALLGSARRTTVRC
jgi:hypothetical protein